MRIPSMSAPLALVAPQRGRPRPHGRGVAPAMVAACYHSCDPNSAYQHCVNQCGSDESCWQTCAPTIANCVIGNCL